MSAAPGEVRLSVVIPTLDAAETLPACLRSLRPGIDDGLVVERIIADGGSRDATATRAAAEGCRIVPAIRGRGAQLRAGARAATGNWLLFLHADTRLAPGWPHHVRRHLADAGDRAAAFRLAFDSERPIARWAEWLVWLRVAALALPYGDQGLLVSRHLHDAVGGYPELDAFEDVEIVRRIGRRRLRALPVAAITSAGKYERDGWLARSGRNLALLARYLAGEPPAQLARAVR